MQRREFITLLGGAAVAWPLAARAQQPAMPVLGFLHGAVADGYTTETAGFRQGLREAGYNEGQNVAIEYRWAEGHYERLPDLAADLVRRNVAVIVAASTPAALAAKAATATIPIVFEIGVDPVASGLVASLNRPGGNITGIVNLSPAAFAKRIEMMHQILPDAKIIAVLLNPGSPTTSDATMTAARAAQAPLGIQVQFLQARTTSDIEAAFAKVVELKAGALVIDADPFFVSKQNETAALAARYGVPTIDIQRGFVTAGGLMSYGGDLVDAYRLTGGYAGRILKGEKPADLPVQQSDKIQMAINLKTAKALGLTIPLPLIGRADEIIE
jgi:putative tryptophan/tyrosine transport system substrate-binding protein